MDDFLAGLAKRVKRNTASLEIFRRLAAPATEVPSSEAGSPLQTKVRRRMRPRSRQRRTRRGAAAAAWLPGTP